VDDETVAHFRAHGWMRVRAAFSADQAAAMREVVWAALANAGIEEGEPSTWTAERPEHLQPVKKHPAFRAVGSPRLLHAIDAALEGQRHEPPKTWGAAFLAFPSSQTWHVPFGGWHADANYLSALSPPDGLRTHALFGDVAPRAGGSLVLSGSHRLVHDFFTARPPGRSTRGADRRQELLAHPYIRDLHTDGDAAARVARFMDRVEEHQGIELQVVENAGQAGDVMLLHPLTLHVAVPNNGRYPRFLLSGGVDLPSMWPQNGF
jgi:hypothetical protein